jgi:hypothetical protein
VVEVAVPGARVVGETLPDADVNRS